MPKGGNALAANDQADLMLYIMRNSGRQAEAQPIDRQPTDNRTQPPADRPKPQPPANAPQAPAAKP